MDVLWPDAELESLAMDYDEARIVVRETTGRVLRVVGAGVIGLEYLGIWDEVIIERGEVVTDDSFGKECFERARSRLGELPDSGSPARNTGCFSTLIVTFADGSQLRVAAAGFSTNEFDAQRPMSAG
jgi:hypothetical protein